MNAAIVVAHSAPSAYRSRATPRARSQRRCAGTPVSHATAEHQSTSPDVEVRRRCLQVQGKHKSTYPHLVRNVNNGCRTPCLDVISSSGILTFKCLRSLLTLRRSPGHGNMISSRSQSAFPRYRSDRTQRLRFVTLDTVRFDEAEGTSSAVIHPDEGERRGFLARCRFGRNGSP